MHIQLKMRRSDSTSSSSDMAVTGKGTLTLEVLPHGHDLDAPADLHTHTDHVRTVNMRMLNVGSPMTLGVSRHTAGMLLRSCTVAQRVGLHNWCQQSLAEIISAPSSHTFLQLTDYTSAGTLDISQCNSMTVEVRGAPLITKVRVGERAVKISLFCIKQLEELFTTEPLPGLHTIHMKQSPLPSLDNMHTFCKLTEFVFENSHMQPGEGFQGLCVSLVTLRMKRVSGANVLELLDFLALKSVILEKMEHLELLVISGCMELALLNVTGCKAFVGIDPHRTNTPKLTRMCIQDSPSVRVINILDNPALEVINISHTGLQKLMIHGDKCPSLRIIQVMMFEGCLFGVYLFSKFVFSSHARFSPHTVFAGVCWF